MAKSREVLSKAQEQLDYATSRCGNLMEQLDKIRDQMKWHHDRDRSDENLADTRGDNKESDAIQLAREAESIGSDLSNSSQNNDYSEKVDKKWDKFYKKLSKDYKNRHKLSRSSSSYESLAASDTLSTKSTTTEDKLLINKGNRQSNEIEGKEEEDEEEDELVMEAMEEDVFMDDDEEIIDVEELEKELEDFSEEEIEIEEVEGPKNNENVEEDIASDGILSDDYEKELMENENTPGMYHYRRESSGRDESQEEDENNLEVGQENENYYDMKRQEEYNYEKLEENIDKELAHVEEINQQSERETNNSTESLKTGRNSQDTFSDSPEKNMEEMVQNNNYYKEALNRSNDGQEIQEEITMLNAGKENLKQEGKSLVKTKSKENMTQTDETRKIQNKHEKIEKHSSNEGKFKEQPNVSKRVTKFQGHDLKDHKGKSEANKKVDLTKRTNNPPSKAQELTVKPSSTHTKGTKNKLNVDNTIKSSKKVVPNKKSSHEHLNTVENFAENPRQIGNLSNKNSIQQQQQQDKKSTAKNMNIAKDNKDVKNIQESRKGNNTINKKSAQEMKSKEQDKTKTKTVTHHAKQETVTQNRKQEDVNANQDRQNLRTPTAHNVRQKSVGQPKTKNAKNEAINSNHLIQLNYTDVENNLYMEKLTKLKHSSNKIRKSQNVLKPNMSSHEIISKGLLDNIQKTLRDNLNRPSDINYNNGEVQNNINENTITKNAVKNKVNLIELNTNNTTTTKNVAKKESMNDKNIANNLKQKPKEAPQKQKLTKTTENTKTTLAKDETTKVRNKNVPPGTGNLNNTNELNMFKTFGQDEDDGNVDDCRDEETLNLVTTNRPGTFDLKSNKVPHKVESAQHINKHVKVQERLARPGTENVKPPPKFMPYHKSNKIWEETIPEVEKTYVKGQTYKTAIPNVANNNNNKENTAQSLAQSLGFNAIPFIVGQSTSRSYHIGLNIQQTMSLMKHSPSMPALKLGIEPSAGNNCDKTSSFGSILSTSYYKAKTCPACATKPFNSDEEEEIENTDDPWYVPQKDAWDKQNIANRKRARCTCLPKNVISFNEVLNQLFQKEGFTQVRPLTSETQVIIKSEEESEKDEKENKKIIVRPNNAFYFTRLLRNIQRIQDQYMPTTKLSLNSIKYNTL